jgi:F0F1-type ATP synthase membrane subunit a
LNTYLGIDAVRRPVTAFIAPIIFVGVFRLLFFGFLPYSTEFIINPWFVGGLSFAAWFGAFLHMISVKRFRLYFVGKGYPLALVFFLVPIELIREFVKPFSLGIRLYVNVALGHYLLLGAWWVLDHAGPLAYVLATPLVIFEVGVFLIQSFIFTFLVIMYHAE